jgi:hypothetical protein
MAIIGTKRLPLGIIATEDFKEEVSDKLLPEIQGGDAGKRLNIDGTGSYETVVTEAVSASFVGEPNISGPVSSLIADGTSYGYTASGSVSVASPGSPITYHWSISDGNISSSTGTSTNATFALAQNDTNVTLSCYAKDDQDNISPTTDIILAVDATVAPSGLSLSLPTQFVINMAEQLDVTVGDDGGDPNNISYSWEISENDGSTWITTGLSNALIKNPTMTFTTTDLTVKVRCTVSNTAAGSTATSDSLVTVDIVSDADSQFIDSTAHSMTNTSMEATALGASLLEVPTGLEVGADVTFGLGNGSQNHHITYIGNNKVVACYNDGANSNYGTGIVGTVSGNSIVWDSSSVFESGTTSNLDITSIGNNKVVAIYQISLAGKAVVGTVTGTSISWGTPVQYFSRAIYQSVTSPEDDKVVIVFKDDSGAGGEGTGVVGTVSGTSISYGSLTQFNTSITDNTAVCSLSGTKVLATFRDKGNSNYGTSSVGTISGTSITWGSKNTYNTDGGIEINDVIHIGSNKVVAVYRKDFGGGYAASNVGVVNTTSNTTVWETPVDVNSINSSSMNIAYIGNNNVIIDYNTGSNVGTIDGTTITWGEILPNAGNSQRDIVGVGDKAVRVFRDSGNSSASTSNVLSYIEFPFAQNDLIQLPDGKLDVVSSVDVSQELTPYSVIEDISSTSVKINRGTDVTLFNDTDTVIINGDTDVLTTISGTPTKGSVVGTGDLSTGSANDYSTGDANYNSIVSLGNNKIVVCYRHGANGGRGTSCVGTLSGTNITWETPVAFNDHNTFWMSACYAGNNTITAFYRNEVTGQGKSVTGTFNPTTNIITWGTPAAAVNDQVSYCNIAYLGDGYYAAAFANGSSYGQVAIAQTLGGNANWGPPAAVFNTAATKYISLASIGNNKIVVVYQNAYQGPGTAIVGVVNPSAGTVAWETPVTFCSSGETNYTNISSIGNNKVVVCYQEYVGGSKGTSIVGTVDGSNIITFGTPAIFSNVNSSQFSSVSMENNKVFVAYVTTSVGQAAVGTVVGTSITWNTPQEYVGSEVTNIAGGYIGDSISLACYKSGNGGSSNVLTHDATTYNTTLTFADNRPANPTAVNTITADGDSAQAVYLTNEDAASGTVKKLTAEYSVPSIEQDGGQADFREATIEAQWTRNKTSVTEDTGDVVIAHGSTVAYPFVNGNKVMVSGDTDVVTTINADPTRGSAVGTGNMLAATASTPVISAGGTMSIVMISTNKFVACYELNSSSSRGVVGTISGDTISWGAEAQFTSNDTSYICVVKVDTDKFVVTYNDNSTSNYGKGCLGTVSDTTITFYSPVTFESANCNSMTQSCSVGTNKVVVSYKDVANGNSGTSCVGTVSGNTLSWGTPTVHSSNNCENNVVEEIATDKVMVAYMNNSVSEHGFGVVGTVSGTSISWGTPVKFSAVQSTRNIRLAKVDDDKVVIVYNENSGGTGQMVVVGTVSGTAITWGTPVEIETNNNGKNDVHRIDSDKVLICWSSINNGERATATVGTISGTSISIGTPIEFWTAAPNFVNIDEIESNKFIVGWQYSGVKANILTYDGTSYSSTISLTDTIPTNVATIESLPLELEADLDDGATVTLAPLTETYEVVNSTTMKATATLSGDQGDFADVKVKAVNTDLNEPTVTRIQVDFGV